MKDRPILFSAALVRAILAGTKTQTRRIAKGLALQWLEEFSPEFVALPENGLCPYGQPGDRLWVREAWKAHTTFDHLPPREIPQSHVWYLADPGYKAESRTRASMHMPRWASRITLEITSVRVERLQEISEADALAEGISSVRSQSWDRQQFPEWRFLFDAAVQAGTKPPIGPSPTETFAKLWASINGDASWHANPWVWAITFKRIESTT